MARYANWLNGLVTPDLVARDLLVEAPLVHPASAIRRDVLEGAGGWCDGDFPEDYDLWLRLSAAGHRLSNLPEVLLDWRESPGRLTRTDGRYALPRHVALKAAWLASGPLSDRREVASWGAGETGRSFARALAPHGVAVVLFLEVDPRKIGRTVAGAPVVSYEEAARARGLPLLVAVGATGRATSSVPSWVAGASRRSATTAAWPEGSPSRALGGLGREPLLQRPGLGEARQVRVGPLPDPEHSSTRSRARTLSPVRS